MWDQRTTLHTGIVSTDIREQLHDALFRFGSSVPMLALRSKYPVSALAPWHRHGSESL